jgi:hypothetical protein
LNQCLGTSLLLEESGFERIREERRVEACAMNGRGWTEQMKNIEKYVGLNAWLGVGQTLN